MPLFSRKPKPLRPPHPSLEAVAAGLTAFAADLLAGDHLAVVMASEGGEMPLDAEEWAAYPTAPHRLERLAHFGGPSPEEHPRLAAIV